MKLVKIALGSIVGGIVGFIIGTLVNATAVFPIAIQWAPIATLAGFLLGGFASYFEEE